MSGTVVFQVGSLATPGPGIVVGQDDVGGTAWQYIKIDVGPAGTSRPVSYAGGTGVPVSGLGTFQALGSVQGVGTFQVLGSVQTVGTSQVLGSVQGVGTFQVLGTVQTHGTSQVLGSVQTVGTSQVLGSVQTVGTSQVLGSVQTVGTSQVLGTTQPLAGSVHLANVGTVVALGSVAHGAVIGGAPVLMGGFGSSGTQAAVADGQAVRAWYDLNGRLQVRGTIDSIPSITVASMPTTTVTGTVQTHGTSQVLGTVQTHGTSQVLGSVQGVGTFQVLGSVQGVGTYQVLGSVQAVGTTQTKEIRSTAPTTTSVAATVGNIILLASNANRLGAAVYLEGGSALYLKLGSLAGTLDYTVQITQSAYYEVPFNYSGTISGIWQFAGGTARITEIT